MVFAQSGSRGRLGNTFHYPYLARRFAEAGIPTLRFDPAGLGDSTGTIPAGDMRDLYGRIGAGLFVEDTLNAIEEFTRHVRPQRLLVFGVCGGAATALLTAPRSPKVDGAILLSLPVLLDGAGSTAVSWLPKSYARDVLVKSYAGKLLSFRAWTRFLTGKSDTRRILEFAVASVRRDRHGGKRSQAPEHHPNPRFNHHTLEAMDALTERGKRVLVLFGQEDGFRHYWESEFHRVYWDHRPNFRRHIEVHYVAGCNHMFTLREWQNKAVELSMAWLEAAEREQSTGKRPGQAEVPVSPGEPMKAETHASQRSGAVR